MQYKVRRVATAAGVRRFGQPLHSIITADFVPNFPVDTPLGSDHHDIGRRVRYNGPDAPAHNLIDVEGTLVKFRRNNGQSIAEIRDDDGITHVVNVPSGTWSRMSYVMAPIEPSGHKGWEVSTINGTEYWVGMYNRRWYVLKDADFDQEIGKFKTRDEAIEFLDKFAATPRPKNRVSRTRRAKEARDTDFPSLIQEAIVEDADRRAAAGKPKQTAKDRDAIAKPFHQEMQRRGLAFYDTMPLGTWFTPLNDSALKHGTYRKRSKREFVSELGVVYSSAHIGPVVRPISARKVLEATLDSVISILRAAETKSAAKVLQGIQDELEEKSVVRHVRTPEGVRKYGLPIGAVIVADSAKKPTGRQLSFIWETRAGKEDADGFVTYVGTDDDLSGDTSIAARYRVGKQNGKWVALDTEGTTVATGASEASVLESLDKYSKKRVIKIHSRSDRGANWVETHGKRPVPEGMHRATGDELVDLKLPYNRKIVDIFIYDEDNPKREKSYGYGYDRKGNASSFTRKAAAEKRAVGTFATVEKMQPLMPAFEQMLKKRWRENDTYKALWFMRRFKMRVGTKAADRKQTDPESRAFGATKILVSHVKIKPDGSIRLEIPSKKKGLTIIEAKDPTTKAIIKEAIKGKKPTEALFPDTNHSRTERIIKQHFGSHVTNHNLRHYGACEEATRIIDQWIKEGYPMPETYEEMEREWGFWLGQIIEEDVLFDKKGQAWKSYLDPNILLAVCGDHPEWVDTFRDKYQQKGVAE